MTAERPATTLCHSHRRSWSSRGPSNGGSNAQLSAGRSSQAAVVDRLSVEAVGLEEERCDTVRGLQDGWVAAVYTLCAGWEVGAWGFGREAVSTTPQGLRWIGEWSLVGWAGLFVVFFLLGLLFFGG